jgi:hypothetical protein
MQVASLKAPCRFNRVNGQPMPRTPLLISTRMFVRDGWRCGYIGLWWIVQFVLLVINGDGDMDTLDLATDTPDGWEEMVWEILRLEKMDAHEKDFNISPIVKEAVLSGVWPDAMVLITDRMAGLRQELLEVCAYTHTHTYICLLIVI